MSDGRAVRHHGTILSPFAPSATKCIVPWCMHSSDTAPSGYKPSSWRGSSPKDQADFAEQWWSTVMMDGIMHVTRLCICESFIQSLPPPLRSQMMCEPIDHLVHLHGNRCGWIQSEQSLKEGHKLPCQDWTI